MSSPFPPPTPSSLFLFVLYNGTWPEWLFLLLWLENCSLFEPLTSWLLPEDPLLGVSPKKVVLFSSCLDGDEDIG